MSTNLEILTKFEGNIYYGGLTTASSYHIPSPVVKLNSLFSAYACANQVTVLGGGAPVCEASRRDGRRCQPPRSAGECSIGAKMDPETAPQRDK